MGSLISWVVILTTLGNIFYVQISVAFIETPILFNIVKGMHDTVTKMESILYMFSRSIIRINSIRKF